MKLPASQKYGQYFSARATNRPNEREVGQNLFDSQQSVFHMQNERQGEESYTLGL
jgi:hypothetical protein